ncbi:MAG: hypothetical protein EIB84_05215 [Spiroplasma poulsonii]|uniref:Uncharacterized protein n=2 Tax=Spiroplasma poulsonii TaxID=2138 RepID=A0A2P6FBJ6_9MOLU|nr:hypothetical protein [Spiroplasma poulsonii]KAF0851242.1 putative transmembrane protein [Spiroplasma poulsonii]MBW1242197.1 hypothetical protein [Spiroplasma poulsonii]PQM30837.1 hypothetical protein SMSRO_SF006280 [Spiroplasma poulsonii]PWF95828.1 hypothetical protein SMSE_12650 [Spiroplasma poulsonii]PWF98606.1 hypothetical protein SMH99_11680 [Spiroplasma poulsonii]
MKKEKTILSKGETASKMVQKIQFVEDNRPASLKSLDKTVVDKTVKSLGEYELKRKKQNKPLPYHYNVDATKYYFATKGETLARIMIIFGQLMLIVVSLVYIPTLSQVLAHFLMSLVSKLNTSFTGPIVIALIILLSIAWVSTFFFLTIPILTAQTLRTVHIWTIIVSIVGNINFIIVFLIAVLQVLYIKGSVAGLNINPFILSGIILAAFVCFAIGCMALQNNRKKYQRKVENELANQIRATRG